MKSDALSLFIVMARDTVDSMQTIDDAADQMNEEKRKNPLSFFSAIFFFIPIVGQLVSSLTVFAGIGRIIALIGAAGNTALTIHDVVNDPGNAPLAMFGLILEPVALLDFAKVNKVASFYRAMPADELKKLGAKTSARMTSIDNIKGRCRVLSKRDRFPVARLPMSSLTGEEIHGLDFVHF